VRKGNEKVSWTTISLIGFVITIITMIYLCMRGINVYITAIVASAIAIVFSNLPLGKTLLEVYAPGFASFMSLYFFRYLWGTIFGILMEKCGAAYAVANGIVRLFGKKYCLIALPVAVAIMAFSGMAGTVSVFVSIPIYLRVFKECNLPKRFIPGLFCFGCGSFINFAPGSAQNVNIIATRSVGLDPTAGLSLGLVGCTVMFVLGLVYTYWAVGHAVKNGEVFFDNGKGSISVSDEDGKKKPPLWLALIPMLVVILLINVKPGGKPMVSVETAVFLGCLATPICMWKYTDFSTLIEQCGDGANKSISMIGAVCAMSGFGKSIMATPAYDAMIKYAMSLRISPLFALFVGVSIVCVCTSSGTAAISITGPTLGKTFVELGLDPVVVARVMAVSCTVFESLPQNAVIVLLINSLCGETYKDAYYPYMVIITIVIPFIATMATIGAALMWGMA
jgi:H+/gluconate symporter-like permease